MASFTSKSITVTTSAAKIISEGEAPYGSPVIFQAAQNLNVYIGGPNVSTANGVLVPTAAAGGSVPCVLPLGGKEIWAVSPSGTVDLRLGYTPGASTETADTL